MKNLLAHNVVCLFKITDKDAGIDRLLMLELSQRNNNVRWSLCGVGKDKTIDIEDAIEQGDGTRANNISTLYRNNDKYATLKFSQNIDNLSVKAFGQYERTVDLHYIQAQYLGRGVFEKNGKLTPMR